MLTQSVAGDVHVLFSQPMFTFCSFASGPVRDRGRGEEKSARSHTYIKGPSLKFFKKTIFDIHKFSVI